ncbi:cysteine hydrolase family protein [Streptomyces sp. NPDC058297]|uniref:cysteine hydrolase family protein n=1 Tax=unclassified Streptomyces TaxID=2593676 RepID=UPI0036EEB89D
MSTPISETTLVPRKTALLLMDLQPAVLSHIPDPEPLIEKAQEALAWAREHGVQVVFVRVGFAPEDYDSIPDHHKAFGAVKQGRLFDEANPSLAVDPALEVRDGDLVVRKTRYGAFSTTDLHALLRDRSIDTLVMGGISTSGVVLSSVRDAADQDYRIFVLADVTDDHDEEVHRVLIEKVLPRQADVITTADLKGLFRDA